VQIPTHKHKKYEKQGNMSPPKVKSATIKDSNDKEVNEIPDK
jgi:hypothetical protein